MEQNEAQQEPEEKQQDAGCDEKKAHMRTLLKKPGLQISKGSDGVWLHFKTAAGKHASIHLWSCLGEPKGNIISESLKHWLHEYSEHCTEDSETRTEICDIITQTMPDVSELVLRDVIDALEQLVIDAADDVVEERLDKMQEMMQIQGSKGNWDHDEYMRGMYNGMELMMAVLEDRDPAYKDAPKDVHHGADGPD